MENNKIKAIIFDFDGTIADTLPFIFEKVAKIAKMYNIENDKDLIKKIKILTPKEIIKKLKIKWFQFPFIFWEIKKAQKELYNNLDRIKIFSGIKNLLKSLKKRRIRVFIYSSNIKKNIDYFLKKNKIDSFFEKIYVGGNFFGKDKDLLDILKKENLKKDEVFYVGDEIRDVLACHKAKIKIIGVEWGLAGRDGFKKHKPNFLIKKPHELLNLLS